MLGMSKSDRDFLGRWEAGAHQSDEYVVTSKEVVHRLQREINKKLCQGAEGVNESHFLRCLKEYGEKHLGEGLDLSGHRIWRRNGQGQRALITGYPLIVLDTGNTLDLEMAASTLVQEESAKDGELPYWVSVSRRKGFRRLHARNKCGVIPWTVYKMEWHRYASDARADAWCQTCWRKVQAADIQEGEASSTSGTSSSTESEQMSAAEGVSAEG